MTVNAKWVGKKAPPHKKVVGIKRAVFVSIGAVTIGRRHFINRRYRYAALTIPHMFDLVVTW